MRKPALTLALVAILLHQGCSACTNQLKHWQSQAVGLSRRVTLYDCNGVVLKEWTGKFTVEAQGPALWFITEDNRTIVVSGTVVIEELP